MKKGDFTELLQHPQHIDTDQISDVRSIIDEFPFFQPARAIYLKGLKNKESFKYNQELKTTAAFTTDRSVLFDFITSEEFSQNSISEKIKQNLENLKAIELYDIEDLSVNQSVALNEVIKKEIQKTEPILEEIHIETEPELIIEVEESVKTPEEKLKIGKPLEFDRTEMHSFGEWLKITSFKPIIRDSNLIEKNSSTKGQSRSEKDKLIDKFIEANPKIKPIRSEGSFHDLASAQMLNSESLMTETLARIYLEQKNYDKAIHAYKILSLKYPEKSGFFADQIQAIKKIQE
jgi:hypothetical protein